MESTDVKAFQDNVKHNTNGRPSSGSPSYERVCDEQREVLYSFDRKDAADYASLSKLVNEGIDPQSKHEDYLRKELPPRPRVPNVLEEKDTALRNRMRTMYEKVLDGRAARVRLYTELLRRSKGGLKAPSDAKQRRRLRSGRHGLDSDNVGIDRTNDEEASEEAISSHTDISPASKLAEEFRTALTIANDFLKEAETALNEAAPIRSNLEKLSVTLKEANKASASLGIVFDQKKSLYLAAMTKFEEARQSYENRTKNTMDVDVLIKNAELASITMLEAEAVKRTAGIVRDAAKTWKENADSAKALADKVVIAKGTVEEATDSVRKTTEDAINKASEVKRIAQLLVVEAHRHRNAAQ